MVLNKWCIPLEQMSSDASSQKVAIFKRIFNRVRRDSVLTLFSKISNPVCMKPYPFIILQLDLSMQIFYKILRQGKRISSFDFCTLMMSFMDWGTLLSIRISTLSLARLNRILRHLSTISLFQSWDLRILSTSCMPSCSKTIFLTCLFLHMYSKALTAERSTSLFRSFSLIILKMTLIQP